MTPIESFFDKIFLLTLERREDRHWSANAMFKAIGIDPYDIQVVYGPDKPIDHSGKPNGNQGCTEGHRRILDAIVRHKIERSLIFEDDVAIAHTDPTLTELVEPQKEFAAMEKEIPVDWDMLYLGGQYADDPLYRVSPHVIRFHRMLTTSSYGIRLPMAKKMQKHIHGIGPIDSLYGGFQPKANCYIVEPRLFVQGTSMSDLTDKVDMNEHCMVDRRHVEMLIEGQWRPGSTDLFDSTLFRRELAASTDMNGETVIIGRDRYHRPGCLDPFAQSALVPRRTGHLPFGETVNVATLVFCTHRVNPLWKYWVDSICNQADFDQRRHLNVIFVDGQLWGQNVNRAMFPTNRIQLADPQFHDHDRRIELEMIVNNRLDYLHIPPLPCVFQGPFRYTARDWFAASNTRNSGFVCAKYPFVAFCDDLSVPGRQWLDQVLHAAFHGYCVAGMYKKVRKLVVENGIRMAHEEFPEGVDSRWSYGSPNGIVPWSGSIFGCSFGVPLETALAIDGFEMATCGSGNEDSDFGIRLRRFGAKIFLNQNMFTFEDEEAHHTQEHKSMATRDRKEVPRERLPAAYDAYQIPNEAEKYFSDHVLINRVVNEARTTPILGQDLRAIRAEFQESGFVPIPTEPTVDWRSGESLATL